jgi:hypothetical protein
MEIYLSNRNHPSSERSADVGESTPAAESFYGCPQIPRVTRADGVSARKWRLEEKALGAPPHSIIGNGCSVVRGDGLWVSASVNRHGVTSFGWLAGQGPWVGLCGFLGKSGGRRSRVGKHCWTRRRHQQRRCNLVSTCSLLTGRNRATRRKLHGRSLYAISLRCS